MIGIDELTGLISGPAGFFIGLLGGVSANFIGNYIWRYYKKPSLVFCPDGEARFQTESEDDVTGRLFRVKVKNTGKEAAENCKPRLNLRGKNDGSEYEVQTNLTWAESDQPTRITINQDEVASFNLFEMKVQYSGNTVEHSPRFIIKFPNEAGTDDPNIVRWIYDEEGNLSDAEFLDNLEKDVFTDIEWDEQSIKVTSRNASSISSSISLEENVEHARDLIGMQLKVDG